jgi:gas vesicle protein GvpN
MPDEPTVLRVLPQEDYVETPHIQELTERSLAYLRAGFPVHYRGMAGTGKTSLALHVAGRLGRPLIVIHGDDELTTSDLVGGEQGFTRRTEVDNFIHSVRKTWQDVRKRWADAQLTTACRYGFTLIYDEFTRSRPEANNVLLSVLEERMLEVPALSGEGAYVRVNPHFAAIFTSNPEEYAGVHKAQDALRDRLITIDLGHFDEETEVAITVAKAKLPAASAAKIVALVREYRETGKCEFTPTLRACIKIGKVLSSLGVVDPAAATDGLVRDVCLDVLTSEAFGLGASVGGNSSVRRVLDRLIDKCIYGQPRAPARHGHAKRRQSTARSLGKRKAAAAEPVGEGPSTI